MKQVYQHHVEARDVRNGVFYTGCFRTREDADEFVESVRSNAIICDYVISSRMGLSPYGTWREEFCVNEYMGHLAEWIGDYAA